MLTTHSRLASRLIVARKQQLSTKSYGPLAADAGALSTRVHQQMTHVILVLTPLAFILPKDSSLRKLNDVGLAGLFSAHSWIGLNYVCTDYVPKISKALLPAARVANVGLAAITFLGMTRIALSSPGGILGSVRGLWNPLPKETKEVEQK